MRKAYHAILKTFFHQYLLHTRAALGLTQSQMAERLAMDDRSYIELDHGKSCCSAITLALFLIYVCHDAADFLEGLRNALEDGTDQAA